MSRIRTIHPKFLESDSMRRVGSDAELVFLKLFLIVDDAGRCYADIPLIAARAFPCRRGIDMALPAWLDALEREKCIHRYRIDDVEYLRIVNWHKYQTIDRPTPSKLPAPPKSASGSRAAREENDKPLDANEKEANSRAERELMKIPRKADGTVDATPEWVKEIVTGILVESTAKGSQDIALRAAHMLGRSIGMLPDGRMRPTPLPGSADKPSAAPSSDRSSDPPSSSSHGRPLSELIAEEEKSKK